MSAPRPVHVPAGLGIWVPIDDPAVLAPSAIPEQLEALGYRDVWWAQQEDVYSSRLPDGYVLIDLGTPPDLDDSYRLPPDWGAFIPARVAATLVEEDAPEEVEGAAVCRLVGGMLGEDAERLEAVRIRPATIPEGWVARKRFQ